MTKEQIESLEKINKRILTGECKKNIGIAVYISDLKNVLVMLEEKDKQIERYINILVTNDMLHVLECEKKDKIIDLMAEKIFEEGIIWNNKEDVRQYFENKVKKGQE